MEDLETSTFGELLRHQRTARGWTQEDLAARAGLSVEAIGTLERGVRHRPRRGTVRLLARALELDEADGLLFDAVARQAIHAPSSDRAAVPPQIGAETEIYTVISAEIRGYSRFNMEQGLAAAVKLAAKFALLTRSGVAARSGTVLDVHDGAATAIFASPRQGLLAAMDLQTRFAQASLTDDALPLTLAIGAETGEAQSFEGGYRGPAVSLAAHICHLAGPSEVLTTNNVTRLTRGIGELEYVNRGSTQFRGFADPMMIVEVHRTASPSNADESGERRGRPPRLPIGGFLGALPTGQIVGREHELSRSVNALEAVTGGTGQFVLLAGEAGIGKTRLAQEVHLNVRNNGFLVAAGRCYELQEAVPFYPFVGALSAVFAAVPDSIRAAAAKNWPYLGQLLPDQVGTYPVSLAGAGDQQRLFRAVAGFLREVADWTPLALLIDDLHWADGSSLALLQYLARDTRSDRIFLLGTYRDVEIGDRHPLRGVLRDLNREGLVTKIGVQRLETDGTSGLIAALMCATSVSEEFTHLVHSRTEGNPYFVEQVMRAMVERGDIFWKNGEWDRKGVEQIDVPETVRSVVGQRLARLSGETQIILHEASVLGQTFHFDDLEAMAHRSEHELDDALEEAAVAGLVRVMASDRYIFDHALTHQTLYDELSPRRKRNLHLAVGLALEGLPHGLREKRAAELAHHFQQGRDTRRALPWTMLAGDQAEAVLAHSDAELHYTTALELATELDDLNGLAGALEQLGRVYRRSARYAEALQTLEQAAGSYRVLGQIQDEARTVGQIGRVYFDEGRTEEGVRRIQPLLKDFEQRELTTEFDQVEAELGIVMAHLLWRGGMYVESATAAARVADYARRTGEAALLAEAESRRGMALANAGDFLQGLRVIEDAIVLAEAAGDVDTVSRAVGNLALFYWDRGDTDKARALMNRSLELCRKTHDPTRIADKLIDFAVVDLTLGEWESARAHLDDADQVLRGISSSWVRVHNTLRRGELYLAQGHTVEGVSLIEAGRDMAERDGDILAECEAAYVLSDEALFSGVPELALSHLQRFLDRHAVDRDDPEALQTWGLALFARVFAELGESDRAEDYLSRVSDEQIVAHLDTVHSVRAVVAACRGEWDEAEQYAEEALAFARRGGFVVSEARLLYFWGRWLMRKGDIARAKDRLMKALAIFERLGALPYTKRTEELLVDCADRIGHGRG